MLRAKRKKSIAKQDPATQKKGWILGFKIFVVATLFALGWRSFIYTKPSNSPIKQVKILAAYEHLDKQTLQQVITPYFKGGFFYLNVIGLKKQLLNLPWVHTVSIQRKWPDAVIIHIVEQQAVLQWGAKALVNSEGAIFHPPAITFPDNLPIVFGPQEQVSEIFTLYQQLTLRFKPLGLTIQKLFLKPQHYWEVLLNNNMVIYLKEIEPLSQIDFLLILYSKIIAERNYPPKSIDLRYNNGGLAVQW